MTARDKDFALWLTEQAALLRARRLGELAVENLSAELEALARRLEREIEDRLAAILAMQIRNVYDRERRRTDKMKIHRERITGIVRDSPSLRAQLEDPATLASAWTCMRTDHDVDGYDLPAQSPWTLEQVLHGVRPSHVLRRRRDEIVRMLAEGGFRNPRVFGSTARGEDEEGSDLDLLVDADSTVSLFDLNGIHGELTRALGIRVDVVLSTSKFPDRIRASIMTDAKPI